MAYIDLNPVRAKLVKRPENYRWNSIGYHVQTENKDNFLSLDFGVKEFGEGEAGKRIIKYRKYIYETGAVKYKKGTVISQDIVRKEQKKKYTITRTDRFINRTRYFTDSGIIGSKSFVSRNCIRFKDFLEIKKERNPLSILIYMKSKP